MLFAFQMLFNGVDAKSPLRWKKINVDVTVVEDKWIGIVLVIINEVGRGVSLSRRD